MDVTDVTSIKYSCALFWDHTSKTGFFYLQSGHVTVKCGTKRRLQGNNRNSTASKAVYCFEISKRNTWKNNQDKRFLLEHAAFALDSKPPQDKCKSLKGNS